MIKNTFIFNPIRSDYIQKCLESLYEYTHMNDCRVIVIDQTNNGLFEDFKLWTDIKRKIHLYLRPHRNLGFSKSMNEGIIHGLRWKSEYITCANDDLEFIDNRWWFGILETFKNVERVVAVNPMSPREPLWGYGLDHGNYMDLIEYKEKFTKEDYDFLLAGDFRIPREKHDHLWKKADMPNTYPANKTGVVDAIATWCTVFKHDFFNDFGLFDERFYPGGGEDYDLDGRVYRKKKRMVGTTKSWVWHWWGSSKDHKIDKNQSLPIIDSLKWNSIGELWPNGFDSWGHSGEGENRKPLYRIPEIGIIDI